MSIQDNSLRPQAIPYQGQICGYNRSVNSANDISKTSQNPGSPFTGGNSNLIGNGDLYPLIQGVSQQDYMIRILRPKHGQIVQAYLNMALTFSGAELNPNFRISVGYGFAADKLTALVPPVDYIKSCMNFYSPTSSWFFGGPGGPVSIYKLNILPLIPQYGSANYVEDFYSIGIHFQTAPVMTDTWHLSKFFITGSILVT